MLYAVLASIVGGGSQSDRKSSGDRVAFRRRIERAAAVVTEFPAVCKTAVIQAGCIGKNKGIYFQALAAVVDHEVAFGIGPDINFLGHTVFTTITGFGSQLDVKNTILRVFFGG